MSSIVEINDTETEVRITIQAPISEVTTAVLDLAKELDIHQEGQTEEEITELVAQATKNWWFEKIITQKGKQIENYANNLAKETKEQLTEQLNSSPLRGA
jgi:uncharacterized membrane protein YgcG